MKLIYPAIFTPCEENPGYTVVVPDLPGCVSEGSSLIDAIEMATWLNTYGERHHLNFSKILQDSLLAMAQK